MSQQPSLASPSAAGSLTPADVWRIIRKRLLLIVACFVVLGLGGTAALVGWYYTWPIYTAIGQVTVEPGQQGFDLTRGFQEGVDVRLFQPYIKSQVSNIRNMRVLTAAMEALEGQQQTYTGANAVYELYDDLSVTHLVDTQHILVSLDGYNTTEIKAIVTEVLTQYDGQLKEERATSDAERQRELRSERDDLSKQLNDLGRKLTSYRNESSVIVADERGGEELARLTALVREVTRAQVVLADANAAWAQFQELRKQAEAANDMTPVLTAFPEVMEAVRRDPGINALSQEVARYNQELQGLKQRFGQQHDSVRRFETAYQAAANDLEAKQSEVLGQLFTQTAAQLKQDYDRARSAEAELQARVAEARAAAVGAASLSAEYRGKAAQYDRAQQLLNTVEDGLERMRISTALARANIRVTQWPQTAIDPSQPKLLLYIPAVIIFSLIVGVGLSLLIELLDNRLRTPAQVARQVGVPVLSSVPDLSEDERLSLDTNIAMVSYRAPQSLIAESFRQLATSLQFASDQPIKSLLVTSPSAGEGKSTVAANLAVTMARSGSRVLLIEGNFRRPTLARIFDVPDSVGLSNVLVGMTNVGEAIQATAVENLDVLVGGAPPPSPALLLGSESMRQLIRQQAADYDRVIIDGSPMLIVADNHLLAPMVDGTVVVFRAGENTRGMAQRAAREILGLRAKLLGSVLNRVRATKGGYYRRSFQAYYDYAGTASPVDASLSAARSGPAARAQEPADQDQPGPGDQV